MALRVAASGAYYGSENAAAHGPRSLIAFWVRRSVANVYYWAASSTTTLRLGIFDNSANGQTRIQIHRTNTSGLWAIPRVAVDVWTHVAIFVESNAPARAWINGVPVSITQVTAPDGTFTTTCNRYTLGNNASRNQAGMGAAFQNFAFWDDGTASTTLNGTSAAAIVERLVAGSDPIRTYRPALRFTVRGDRLVPDETSRATVWTGVDLVDGPPVLARQVGSTVRAPEALMFASVPLGPALRLSPLGGTALLKQPYSDTLRNATGVEYMVLSGGSPPRSIVKQGTAAIVDGALEDITDAALETVGAEFKVALIVGEADQGLYDAAVVDRG